MIKKIFLGKRIKIFYYDTNEYTVLYLEFVFYLFNV